MAKAREITGVSAEIPFREAAALVLRTRAEEVWRHEQRALNTDDVEGVHDMRVATRRLRAALEIFASCFPKKRHRRALRDVKRLADALGARRDPDVMIERLSAAAAQMSAEDAPGIESLAEALREGQAAANDALAREFARARDERLRERLQLLAAEVRG